MSAPATAAKVAADSRRIDEVTAESVRALDAAGIPQLLLKGPTTARWLYRPGELRPYSDTDLLVPAALHERAQAVLEDRGFVDRWSDCHPGVTAPHAVTLYRRRDGGTDTVDLHHTLGLVTDPDAPVWDVLSRNAVDTVVGGQRVRMPDEAGRCLVVALQGAQDGLAGAKAQEDLRRARRTACPAAWDEALARAGKLGVEHPVRLGCQLVGAPLPGTAPDGSWGETPLELRLRLIGAAPGAGSLAALRLHRGTALLGYVARRLLPPRRYMTEVYGARTTPALCGAYLLRLVTLALRTPYAVRDLRRVATPPEAMRASGSPR
ncbi:nucleotidyltransferase family protein [Jidongwangia harbinensis]|uniref:nucleotidyltransferase family protein n=1 Tax=Jidongwangia harbinensis TaxID=2878561 RepID=UPI001CD999F0|nr:nucleotidyltransferase family protein [Jidongwangia harbinensis]MCA2214118.1 nucleotidyltransferase family protein [Jidongwangia harbinensis]